MDNNNVTVQANLDTTQLKKDLEKFKGEISLSANTREMRKQIDNALKDASKNATISLKCTTTGLQNIEEQISSARSQLQKLQSDFNALPKNLNMNVSVNSSGLQQYTSQLQNILKLQEQLNTLSAPSLSTISSASSYGSTATSITNSLSAQAEKKTLSLSTAFDDLTEKGKAFTSWFSTAGIINTSKTMGTNLKKNLD